MKILLVTFSDNADHQDTLYGLFENLLNTERIDVYLLTGTNPRVPLKESNKAKKVKCPKRPGVCKGTFDLPNLLSIIRWINRNKFDVIYFESLHVWNLPIMVFCKNTKIYQVIHEVIPHEGDRHVQMVELMNKAVCKLSNVIVLRNKVYINELMSRYKIPVSRVKYLELWRRYPEYTPPSHTMRVLFFGRINPYKGAENLLEIVRECPEIQFDVIGRVDPLVIDTIERLKQETNVTVNEGYVSDEDMQSAFKKADWVILPYNSASQSGVIIDAYKYSRPVIAFDTGAIREQIENGHTGFLISEVNNVVFAETLKYALNMPCRDYDKMCQDAYDYGFSKYSATGAVDRFLKMLQQTEEKSK